MGGILHCAHFVELKGQFANHQQICFVCVFHIELYPVTLLICLFFGTNRNNPLLTLVLLHHFLIM